ncbi:CapA family protein [Haladaptatus sp. QDMS2]|uniref:CapA family protein n=1 Tax=Haladaptatus sp. QDMS2 TaxID=3033391 RepID=UPI0023E78478|nr:CapA family protein [Haladaptatus sp. QDMS2]
MAPTRRLGLLGDVMLGRLVDERQRWLPPETVWGDCRSRLTDLDGLVCNLECCLSTNGMPWTKTYRPFHFRADPMWAIPALTAAGVSAVSLANNHVMDFGPTALGDTLDHLDAARIAHAGAGRNLDTALDPAVFALNGVRVAMVSFTDNTPEYAADHDKYGTALIEVDPRHGPTRIRVREVLARARQWNPQLLVAALHWGPNMTTSPPDHFVAFAHWLVDEGVDIVYGHSAHLFHGVEVYEDGLILYDTGDFVDDYAVDSHLHNDHGFIFEVTLTPEGLSQLRCSPTEIYDFSVHIARPEAATWCRETMRDRSAPFDTEFERDGEDLVLAL